MQKREKTLAGAAGGFLVIFLINFFVCGDKDEDGLSKSVPQVRQAAVDLVSEIMSRPSAADRQIRREKAPTFEGWGRDPFAQSIRLSPADTSLTGLPEHTLRGIVWKGNKAHVLIGSEILQEGETSGNLKVLDIQKEQVVCRIGHEIITLTLRKNEN